LCYIGCALQIEKFTFSSVTPLSQWFSIRIIMKEWASPKVMILILEIALYLHPTMILTTRKSNLKFLVILAQNYFFKKNSSRWNTLIQLWSNIKSHFKSIGFTQVLLKGYSVTMIMNQLFNLNLDSLRHIFKLLSRKIGLMRNLFLEHSYEIHLNTLIDALNSTGKNPG